MAYSPHVPAASTRLDYCLLPCDSCNYNLPTTSPPAPIHPVPLLVTATATTLTVDATTLQQSPTTRKSQSK